MKVQLGSRTLTVGVIALGMAFASSLIAGPAAGQSIEQAPIRTEMSASGITWQAAGSFQTAILRVAGAEGLVASRRFTGGGALAFDLTRADGSPLADGSYSYELILYSGGGAATLDSYKARARAALAAGDLDTYRDIRAEAREISSSAGAAPVISSRLSGNFRIEGGALVRETEGGDSSSATTGASTPGVFAGPSSPSAEDVVHADDVIVEGSICSSDEDACADGETFASGIDGATAELKLKDNQATIWFNDTSGGGVDWQIGPGAGTTGTSFRIGREGNVFPFQIEAGGPANQLYLDSGGGVGIGTATPGFELEVNDPAGTVGTRLRHFGPTWTDTGRFDFIVEEGGNSDTRLRIHSLSSFWGEGSSSFAENPVIIDSEAVTNSLVLTRRVGPGIGIGTADPERQVHVVGTSKSDTRVQVSNTSATNSASTLFAIDNLGPTFFAMTNRSGSSQWTFGVTGPGSFTVSKAGTGVQEARLAPGGNLTLAGEIFTSGSCSGGCDRVFSPDFELEPIGEHAKRMFERGHLPAVGPTPENGPFNLSAMVGGMLNELEKAHIYIAQLEEEKGKLKSSQAELEGELRELRKAVESVLNQE